MKRFLSLILLIGSFDCAMEPNEGPAPKKQNIIELIEQKDDSKVASLGTLCTNQAVKQFSNMSLEEFFQSNQPTLPKELDHAMASKLVEVPLLLSAYITRAMQIQHTEIVEYDYNWSEVFIKIKEDEHMVINTKSGSSLTICNELLAVAFRPEGLFIYFKTAEGEPFPIHLYPENSNQDSSLPRKLKEFIDQTISIQQALLLKDWCNIKYDNQEFDLANPQIKKVFGSLPNEIKQIIVQSNQSIQTQPPNIISRIKNYYYNHPWKTAAGIGTAALVSYGLWKYFKSDNN